MTPIDLTERMATIVADADAIGDESACTKHGVSGRTLRRYRLKLRGPSSKTPRAKVAKEPRKVATATQGGSSAGEALRSRARDRREGESNEEWSRRRRLEQWAEKFGLPPDEQELEGALRDARQLVATDPSEAMARILARLWLVNGIGQVPALKAVAQLLGVGRGKDEMTAEDRRWAAMTPEERAEAMLNDPIHGPVFVRKVLERMEGSK
jgi:hypothetical protein